MVEVRDRSAAEPSLPDYVTTPLLALITSRALDEDYAHVAARRQDGGQERPPVRRVRWASVVAVAIFGLLVTTVAVQTSRQSEVQELGRAALIKQIQVQRADVVDLQERLTSVTQYNQDTVSLNAGLTQQQADLESTVNRLEVRTGFSAVRGGGVRITVDNQPGVEVNSEIRDEDLATLVDGLWEAGAEAIVINDERVNVLGGIRNTNRAVHVNGRPVNAPYVVSAIGDKGNLQSNLLQTSQGQEWFALVNGLGFRYDAQNMDDLRLPAAPLRPLREVVEMTSSPKGSPKKEEGSP